METLGALPDIPTFDGKPMPVSRNPLTLGTRPLQLLPSPGIEFPVRYETSRMRGFQSEFMPASTVASRLQELRGGVGLLEGLTREDLEVEYRGFSANDFLFVGDFPAYFTSRMQARLPEILEYTQGGGSG
ncbi:hypothetical protein JCGZ_22697 [Jatropha curcas]|uniref:Uncharacterized protein n=1 Tax=Jatropha curcas TaxID=180498 RepID=A0A067K1Y7_JATCU|nr:hypothetical protein JCGZ_22697 [Jatropha curcas]